MKILITGGSGFIGTNAIDAFVAEGHTILNYSLHPPLKSGQSGYWKTGDILNPAATARVFQEFQPQGILHLAARAECDESVSAEEGFRENIDGTKNVLDAIRATPSVERAIITSSQFVCGPGPLPKNDTDYFPETTYGESKVITEKLTREANLSCCWTIVRPTNIWGPWHLRYRREFWRVLQRGFYLHPGRQPVIRCYGYVKNVVYQMGEIFKAAREKVDRKTIYLGDPPADLHNWTNGFSRALAGHNVRVVPRPLMRALALMGDIPSFITGKPFLINSSRLRSMTTDYSTPMERTFDLLGPNPYSLDQGITETVEWLRTYHGPDGTAGGA